MFDQNKNDDWTVSKLQCWIFSFVFRSYLKGHVQIWLYDIDLKFYIFVSPFSAVYAVRPLLLTTNDEKPTANWIYCEITISVCTHISSKCWFLCWSSVVLQRISGDAMMGRQIWLCFSVDPGQMFICIVPLKDFGPCTLSYILFHNPALD